MPTLVEQIQRDALDPKVPVSALLRRVKFAAAKLGLGRVEDWVEQELNGYSSDVPDYRILKGSPIAYSPYYGWQPIGGPVEGISRRATGQSIAELEDMLAGADGDSHFQVRLSDAVSEALDKSNDTSGGNYALRVGRSAIAGIPDRVRTLILDWALELERAGIMGTEFSFNSDEREKAQAASTSITIGTITQFTGNLGSGNTSRDITSMGIPVEQVNSLLEQLRTHLDALVQAGADGVKLDRALSGLEAETKTNSSDQSKLRGLLTDLKHVLTGAAGNLTAQGAIGLINQVLGTGIPTA
jgi:hypothetical protein